MKKYYVYSACGDAHRAESREALLEKFVSLAKESVVDPFALAETILALGAADDLRGLSAALARA